MSPLLLLLMMLRMMVMQVRTTVGRRCGAWRSVVVVGVVCR